MSISERLLVVIDADVKGAIREVDKLGTSAEQSSRKAQSGMDKFASASIKAGTAMIGASVAVGIGLSKTVGAAQEAAIAQEKLKNTIARIPELAGANVRAFNAQALALQRVTVANDEEINAAQAMLGTFHLTERQILKLTPLVVDYARKFDTDLVSASKQVGKAMQGQIGALQRNGIILDKTAYATDKYSAIVKALRENAGGFAEKEGKTFGGQLQILKNQASELEESIGRGVIGVLNDLLPSVNKVASGLGTLDEATGNAVGKFATIGAAVGLAGGALLLFAGTIAKVKTAMAEAQAQSAGYGYALKGLGAVGAAAGTIAIAESIKTVVRSLQDELIPSSDEARDAVIKFGGDGKKAVDKFKDAVNSANSANPLKDLLGGGDITDIGKDFAKSFRNIQNGGKETAAEIKRQFRSIVEASPSTAKKLLDSLKVDPETAKDFGGTLKELDKILNKSVETRRRSAQAAREDAAILNGHGRATEQDTAAIQKNNDALNARRTAMLASFNSEIAAAQSTQALSETLANSQDPLERQAALLAAAGDKAQSMSDKLAAAGVNVDDATVKQNIFKQALQELGNQFPELQGLVNDYIGRLNSIPPNKSTTIDANTAPADNKIANLAAKLALISKQTVTATLGPLFGGGRASGGPVKKNVPYVVGEDGPELFVPNGNGRILNARDSAAKLQAVGSGGGGGNVYQINVTTPAVTSETGRILVEHIRAYERNSGSRWRQN